MRVAVTGSSGFLGTAVTVELTRRGHTWVGVDRSDGYDILGPFLSERLATCDAVIHLAGVLGTEELFDRVDEAIDVNIKGTARVLQAAVAHGLRYVSITMTHVWDNIYQATHLAAENLAKAYWRHFGLAVSHVRAFNAYGPGQKLGKPQKIIPTFASASWAGYPIPIWGNGQQVVDLVHSDDIARMLVDALDYGGFEFFDAGTGQPHRVIEVAAMVNKITGNEMGSRFHTMRKGEHEVNDLYAKGDGWDLLGWRPTFDYDRFRDTVEWYKGR